MPVARDLSNKTIVRNYVAMPDRLQYSSLEVCSATGVCKQTVRNVLNKLYRSGIIIKTAKRVDGRVYFRTRGEADADYICPMDAEKAARLKAASEDMRVHGDEYHQILSEVM